MDFVEDIAKVRKTAHVAPGPRVLALVGERIGIKEALGNPFDYRRLMRGDDVA